MTEYSLDKANKDVAASRQAETVATAANERAKAVLAGLTTRLGELTVALVGAPTEADAQAQLARIDQLTAAVDDADAALRRARTERERAEKSAAIVGCGGAGSVAGAAEGSGHADPVRCTRIA